jgi:HSP90 family molecular chaperone
MSADEAVQHLGTIAKSGTREFMASSKATRRRTPT